MEPSCDKRVTYCAKKWPSSSVAKLFFSLVVRSTHAKRSRRKKEEKELSHISYLNQGRCPFVCVRACVYECVLRYCGSHDLFSFFFADEKKKNFRSFKRVMGAAPGEDWRKPENRKTRGARKKKRNHFPNLELLHFKSSNVRRAEWDYLRERKWWCTLRFNGKSQMSHL